MTFPLTVSDLRQSCRRLAHERGFTAIVLVTLALCLGANIAIFAVVDTVLLRSLPFLQADRLVTVINSYPGAGVERAGASLTNYYDRRGAIKAFSSQAIYQGGSAVIGEAGAPHRASLGSVSRDFFETLGVPMALGRTFSEAEMNPGPPYVAILTDSFWRSAFNADPNVVGRTFLANNEPHTVVGVLPRGFRYLSSRAEFFLPAVSKPEERTPKERHSNNYQLVARLAPGATLSDAQAQMDAFNLIQLSDDPYAELVKGVHFRTFISPLQADHVRDVRAILLLLQAGVVFLLLIGAVNLANLLLVRAHGRSREIAVRQALGASRRHIAREVILEILLLAITGGLLGLGVGVAGVRLLAALGTERLPLGAQIAVDARVAAVALAGAIVLGLALALPILWYHLRDQLMQRLQSETRGGTATRAAQNVRHGFAITQVALAFVLLTGCGLLGLSLRHLLATDPGFKPDHVLTAQLSLPLRYSKLADRRGLLERLLRDLRSQPGVLAAGLTTNLPLSGNLSNSAMSIEGVVPKPNDPIRAHYTSGVFGDFAAAIGLRLVEGRFLNEADSADEAVRSCVVDSDFARRYWPGQSALGHRIVNGPTFEEKEAHVIVGVVAPVKQRALDDNDALGSVYFPFKSYGRNGGVLVIRTVQEPETLGPVVRKLALQLDPFTSVEELKPMQAWIDESLSTHRSPAILAAIFSGVALLLATIGTYGLLAYGVSQRRREIGVRMALGALPGQILGQFLQLGARLLLFGLLIGVLGAWAAGKAMEKILFGVAAFNGPVLALAAAVMAVVVLLATFLPSYQAARTSPVEALRDD